jgi:hypothetical protein
MPLPHSHPDHPSRVVGLVVFLCGIVMLGLVFSVAYHLFSQPVAGLGLSNPAHGTPPLAANIGLSLAAFGERLLLLALLTIVGSVVAGKGVHLCFAAHGPHPRENTHGNAAASEPRNSPVALTVATADKDLPEKTA